ncbi:MAG: hypothetical protein NT062_12320 [Proteobacteria bacterium]|nr:hypothetical protein [Pseudomonadota bacterium]
MRTLLLGLLGFGLLTSATGCLDDGGDDVGGALPPPTSDDPNLDPVDNADLGVELAATPDPTPSTPSPCQRVHVGPASTACR